MRPKSILIEIDILLESMQRSYARIKEESVTRLDLDLLKEKTRRVYDLLIELEESGKRPSASLGTGKAGGEERRAKSEKVIEKEPEPVVVAEEKKLETVSGNGITLADKFMDSDDKTLAARIKMNPIQDLKTAIGLNDKFLFIKELFNNNLLEYNEALEHLNATNSLENAQAYLTSLKEVHQWTEEMEHFLLFRDYVERKYL
ncbi:MAG: hypothetical protein U9R60_03685 [Bacteroidota bacterium]|nr:hypothetical protein [Bacteroidota bacterium]